MKHFVWPVVAAVAVGLIALVLPLLPASAKPAPCPASPSSPCCAVATEGGAPMDPEAHRWLRGHATHWRDCVLQP
ncbi:MAG: hypothetical protein JNM56_12235 [Planctomycetia bacterium]|nr:hypothetical protein [Planctomycetia bacterium]